MPEPMTNERLAYFKARDAVRLWGPLVLDDAVRELTDEIDRLRAEMSTLEMIAKEHTKRVEWHQKENERLRAEVRRLRAPKSPPPSMLDDLPADGPI